MKKIGMAAFAALALALTGACAGDDANVDADLSAEGGDDESIQKYCEFSAELFAAGDESDEDLDRLAELAPEDIKDDVETVVESMKTDEQGEAGPEVEEAENRVLAWEEENCGRESEEGDADAGNDADGAGGDGDNANDNEGPTSGEPGEAGGDDDGGSNSGPGGGENSGPGGETDTTDDGGAEVEAEIEGGTATTAH